MNAQYKKNFSRKKEKNEKIDYSIFGTRLFRILVTRSRIFDQILATKFVKERGICKHFKKSLGVKELSCESKLKN